MAFKKGESGNPNGKEPGTKAKKTVQWEELGYSLLSRHSERANKIMAECDDEMFMDNYTKLLEYFKPKQARVEVKQDGQITVEFIRKDAGTSG